MMKSAPPQVEGAAASLFDESEKHKHKLGARFGQSWRAVRRRARLFVGLAILCLFYLTAIFAELLAPYDYRAQSRGEPLAPPTAIHFSDAQGHLSLRPFIYARRLVDPLERRYEEETERA